MTGKKHTWIRVYFTGSTMGLYDSFKRQQSKLARGRGKLAMTKAGMTHAQWTQNHDPLFRVKGQERHDRSKA